MCGAGSYAIVGATSASGACVACAAGFYSGANATAATGGKVTNDVAGYLVHTFTGNGSIVFTQNTYVDVLVGGGGGGGGRDIGSGGGAGAVIYYPQYLFSAGTYTVTVASVSSSGTAGGNSAITQGSAFIFTAIGGGYGGGGGAGSGNPSTGGSGGGANRASWGWEATALGGTFSTSNVVAGLTGQSPSNSIYVRGTAGGTIAVSGSNYCFGYNRFMCGGAGGGGAGASPGSITPAACTSVQVGGPGLNSMNGYTFSTIFGVAYTSIAQNGGYIGGGGAGGGYDCSNVTVLGGIGGGGSGNMASGYAGGAAIANTCSGGGGGSINAVGGAGASGLVMLRYQPCQACPAGSFAASMGSPICTACTANTFSVPGSSVCAACPVGSSAVSGSTACTAVAGYYDLGKSLLAYYTFDAANMTADSAPIPLGALTASATPPTVGAGMWAGSSAAHFSQATSNEPSSNWASGKSFSLPSFTQTGTDISVCGWYQPPTDSTPTWGGTRSFERVFDFAVSSSGGSNILAAHWGQWNYFGVQWQNGGTVLGSASYVNNYYYPLQWVHFCAVASGTAGNLYLWGGSHPIALSAAITPGVVRASNYIGRSHYDGDSLFQGVIDELRIYLRALTQAEVSAIYAYSGTTTTAVMPMICPAGSYCPSAGLTQQTQCAAGSYCPSAGLTQPTQCAAGSYCPSAGLTQQTQCAAGNYCPSAGLTQPTRCAAGSYCPSAGLTQPTQCAAGGYSAASFTSCLVCPAGSYHNGSGALANLARSCGGGACAATQSSIYQNNPTLYKASVSVDGDIRTGGSGGISDTNAAVNAWWMVDLGAPQNLGAAQIYGRSDCCQTRLDGFMVWAGSDGVTWNGASNTNCYTSGTTSAPHNQGPYYTEYLGCAATARYFWVVLPISNELGMREVEVYPLTCLTCSPGSYCPSSGLTQPTQCAAGSYCPSAGLTQATACAAGSYCATPATQVTCSSGYYCPSGSTMMNLCTTGKHPTHYKGRGGIVVCIVV